MKYDKTLHAEFLKLNDEMDEAIKIAVSKMYIYAVIIIMPIAYLGFTSYLKKPGYNANNVYFIWYTIITMSIIACIILTIKSSIIITKIESVQLKIKEISGADVSNKYFKGFNDLNKIIPRISRAKKGYKYFKKLMADVEKSVSVLPKAYQDEARYAYLKNWFEHKCMEQEQKN